MKQNVSVSCLQSLVNILVLALVLITPDAGRILAHCRARAFHDALANDVRDVDEILEYGLEKGRDKESDIGGDDPVDN